MYGRENDRFIPTLITIMIVIVLVLMIGISVYKTKNAEKIENENEKIVLNVKDWEENTNTFELDCEKIEFVLDASGSNTDVNYKISLNIDGENVNLYTDEFHLYEAESVLTGVIRYKETMEKTIVLYVENHNTSIVEPDSIQSVKPTLNVKVEIVKS